MGNIHGCIFTFEKLLKKLPKNAEPIFIGDLADRGNYSKEVMKLVIENNYRVVFGNYEFSPVYPGSPSARGVISHLK
ncbi:metallophosphoesterase [Nitratiruptor sp. YY08-14]|uniref:metallophosphoesterase n=1 Tax=unclassified Nitratiruptor TaxID=2624044 RepID=UPI00351C5163